MILGRHLGPPPGGGMEAWHSAKSEHLGVSGLWLGAGSWDCWVVSGSSFRDWYLWSNFPCLNNFPVSCLSSQVFPAGPARQSMARMETVDPQGLQGWLADLACQAQWGCPGSVSLPPAWGLQPMPLLASRSLGPSRGHEQPARTEPISIWGPLWVDMHPSSSPGG